MPIPPPPGQRKYATEMALLFGVNTAFFGRPQDLASMEPPEDPTCHLYIVGSRPRISIWPEDVEVTDAEVVGTIRLQRKDEFDRFQFRTPHAFGPGARWVSEWPYETFRLEDAAGDQSFGAVAGLLWPVIVDGWPNQANDLKVLYVGQSFGSAGERTAWDRLESHGTVQKILAELPPDQQLWLSLVTIFDVQLLTEFAPPYFDFQVSDEEDDEHMSAVIEAVHSREFMEKEAVALAEGGLIRAFQPKYNDRMKYNFPARKQVPLETARRLDLHGFIVELQSHQVNIRYYSDSTDADFMHFFGFKVHTDEGRAETLMLSSVEQPADLVAGVLKGMRARTNRGSSEDRGGAQGDR